MRNILITNDDGIDSSGLYRLAAAAAKLGNVTVLAPDGQRSANSHMITLRDTIDVYPVLFPIPGVNAYAATGTPADCVRLGIQNFIKGKTDLVLSGINFGYNVGADIQYSATVGAALEAASCGIRAIALSESFAGKHKVTDLMLDQILTELANAPLERNAIWNVNFPECDVCAYKGVLYNRTVNPTGIFLDFYEESPLDYGGTRLTIRGDMQTEAEEGTDYRAVLDGCISVGKIHNIG